MIMTLKEVHDTCDDWLVFCNKHGFNEWSINEGGEKIQVSLTLDEAKDLGIIKMKQGAS